MKEYLSQLNKAFDHRVRLGIMSALMVNESVDFKTLKELIGASDGNLASHIKTLEKEGHLTFTKTFVGRKPNTQYQVTDKGREAFAKHLEALEQILKNME